jgi:myo-inositol-1(or 4)-monophosphatase
MANDLNLAIKMAREAGDILLEYWSKRDRLPVQNKGSGDFVSEADRAAEEHLRQGLLTAKPMDGWRGEETGTQVGGSRCWIVDPLDGTTNFLRGIGHWAVSVALEDQGVLRVGVVHDPVKNETFAAELGRGATLNGIPIKCLAPSARATD